MALSRYWRDNPPVHVAVARYLGIGSAKSRADKPPPHSLMAQAAFELGPPRKFMPPIPIVKH